MSLTGRTHQIRAHATWLGHPCAGDARYLEEGQLTFWRNRGLDRLFLHAHSLEIESPAGELLHLSAELPTELREFMDRL